jgi:hypothetical protein
VLTRRSQLLRTIVGTTALLACADVGQPTQPTESRARSAGGSKPSADVIASSVTQTTFYACYTPGKGTVYRIKTSDTPQACEKKDVEFSWTDRASSPISGLTFHNATVTIGTSGRFFATCDAGQSVVNFGYEIPVTSTATTSQIRGSRPTVSGGQGLWVFVASPGTEYVFYWNCADADAPTVP